MMLRKKNLFIFCCFIFVYSFGQSRKPHIIKLLPNKDEPIEAVDFYVADVIDNRIYKNNIGIAQKGIFNKKVLSKFNKPFHQEILSYLHSVFPVEPSKEEVVLRINQLLISENTGAFKETGKAIINLDVLRKSNGSFFLLGNFSAYREKNSADVTRKHDDRIRAILVDCMLQYQEELNSNIKIEPRLISTRKAQKTIILEEAVNEGFFYTFHELYNNIPFVDSSIKFKEKGKESNKIFLDDRDHKRALYYAFSNGETVFLNASSYSGEKHFVRTEIIDRFLLFNDAFVHQDDAIGMSMAFGVLGILATNRKSHVLLDLYTGQFHVLKENKIKVLLRSFPQLYETYKDDRNDILIMKEILETLFRTEDNQELREKLITKY